MANHKSAIKRIRTSARRRIRNRVYKSQTRTAVKKARVAIASNAELETAIEETRLAVSQLDKAASKGIIHKNTASRTKSRLMKKLAALEAEKTA